MCGFPCSCGLLLLLLLPLPMLLLVLPLPLMLRLLLPLLLLPLLLLLLLHLPLLQRRSRRQQEQGEPATLELALGIMSAPLEAARRAYIRRTLKPAAAAAGGALAFRFLVGDNFWAGRVRSKLEQRGSVLGRGVHEQGSSVCVLCVHAAASLVVPRATMRCTMVRQPRPM